MLWTIGAVPVLVLIATSVSAWRQWRQDHLNYQLIRAVKNLDAIAVNRLLDEGAGADARDSYEPPLTPSRLPARLQTWFRNRGGSKAAHDNTALQLMMNDGRLDWRINTAGCDAIAVLLVQHGADTRVRGTDQRTLLREAARCGLHRTVDLLLSRGADLSARDAAGRTALMGADKYSTTLLIERGADVHARDSHRMTALFYAADVDVAKVLIHHGAVVNLTDDRPRSILRHAQINDRSRLVPFLVEHGARLTRREQAVQTRNTDLL